MASSARRCAPATSERAMRLFVAHIVTDPDAGELAEKFTRNLLRFLQITILSTWLVRP